MLSASEEPAIVANLYHMMACSMSLWWGVWGDGDGGGGGGGGGGGSGSGGAAMVKIPNPPLHSVAFLVHPTHAQHIRARAAVRVLHARREEPAALSRVVTPAE